MQIKNRHKQSHKWRISEHYCDYFGEMDLHDFEAMVDWLIARGTPPKIGTDAEEINANLVKDWQQRKHNS